MLTFFDLRTQFAKNNSDSVGRTVVQSGEGEDEEEEKPVKTRRRAGGVKGKASQGRGGEGGAKARKRVRIAEDEAAEEGPGAPPPKKVAKKPRNGDAKTKPRR